MSSVPFYPFLPCIFPSFHSPFLPYFLSFEKLGDREPFLRKAWRSRSFSSIFLLFISSVPFYLASFLPFILRVFLTSFLSKSFGIASLVFEKRRDREAFLRFFFYTFPPFLSTLHISFLSLSLSSLLPFFRKAWDRGALSFRFSHHIRVCFDHPSTAYLVSAVLSPVLGREFRCNHVVCLPVHQHPVCL